MSTPSNLHSAKTSAISPAEFIALIAMLISLVALSIDAMMPALAQIGADLHVGENDRQLIISAMFVGLAIAQIFFGPLSDGWGRKPAILCGLSIFTVGCGISMMADTFTVMLVGRVLQGAGAAGPRIVATAMVRDQFKGASMARIMSMVMSVFMVVPAIAPAIGQGILVIGSWRSIYAVLLTQGVIAGIWLSLRQPETLAAVNRMPFSARRIFSAISETCRNRTAFGFTLAAGLIFGAFLGYLNSAQQIFQDVYGVGSHFPLYFGGLAIILGAATIINARVVERVGMFVLSLRGVWVLSVLSSGFILVVVQYGGVPPLSLFMVYMSAVFFCMGILFGNFNALALEPLGHIAGTAAAVIASLSSFLSLFSGIAIGRAFNGSVLPLVVGLAILCTFALPILYWIRRGNAT